MHKQNRSEALTPNSQHLSAQVVYNKKFEELVKHNKNLANDMEDFEADILDELTPHNQIEMDHEDENIEDEGIENDFQAQDIAFSQNNIFLPQHQNHLDNFSV